MITLIYYTTFIGTLMVNLVRYIIYEYIQYDII